MHRFHKIIKNVYFCDMISLILAALIPSLILIAYICFKDRLSPEPPKYLVKAFVFGMLSASASMLISMPLLLIGAYTANPVTVLDHFRVAFFGAGIPEEIAKFVMLWLVLRKNPAFDEHFDGIVYAVCVGMGFAFVENIGYLCQAGDAWIHAGIARGLISVPGHYVFAILMGYYYSYAHFSMVDRRKNQILTLAAPILGHTLFDWVLMVSEATEYEYISYFLTAIFFYGFFQLQKLGHKDILAHLANDAPSSGIDDQTDGTYDIHVDIPTDIDEQA